VHQHTSHILVVAALSAPWIAHAQIDPPPERVEVGVTTGDGGTPSVVLPPPSVDAGAADGGAPTEATLVPPVLATPSPAAYPEALTTERLSGSVILELLVDEQGSVGEVTVAEASHPAMAAAATDAAQRLKFTPARLGDKLVAVRIRYTYNFVAPPPPPGILKGFVREMGTREPIAGAWITGPEGKALVETGPKGEFEVSLPPGTYKLHIGAAGHQPIDATEEIRSKESLDVLYRVRRSGARPYETIVRGERETVDVARTTLTGAEIHEVPGTMGDPFRVILLMPGVTTLASGLSFPVVRGMEPSETGYYVDGVRVPSLFHLFLGPAVIYPDFLETLDFYESVPPVQYGRNLGGVIDAQVTKPRDDLFHASAYADLINAGAMVDSTFSTGTTVTLSGRFSYTGLLLAEFARLAEKPDAQGYYTDPEADFYDYQARIEQKLGQTQLRLLVFGSSDLIGEHSENPQGFSADLYDRFWRVDLRGRTPLGPGRLELGATVGQDAVGLEGTSPTFAANYFLSTTSVSARGSWEVDLTPKLRLTFGGDAEQQRARYNLGVGTSTSPNTPASVASEFYAPTAIGLFSGLYVDALWKPASDWSIEAGVRGDDFHLDPGIDRFGGDPRLTVRKTLFEGLVLKGGVGITHQPPTVLIDLPLLDIAGLRYGLQQAVPIDVGAEWRPLPDYEIDLSAYYTAITNAIEFSLADVFLNERQNQLLGQNVATWGRAYGVELMLRHALGGNWFGWVSATLQRSTRWETYVKFDNQYNVLGVYQGELPFAFDETFVFNATLSYRFPWGITAGLVFHFNTGRPESGQISSRSEVAVTDPATGQLVWHAVSINDITRLPSFYRFDARISKEWTKDVLRIQLYLDWFNVTANNEILGYTYGNLTNPDGTPGTLTKTPISIPIVVPMLGLKVVY
jgi:TonB family protein